MMIPRGLIVGAIVLLAGIYLNEIGYSLTRLKAFLKDSGIEEKPMKVWFEENIVKYKHLVIFGHVFDVSSAPKFYGENGHYNFFTGADTTRAFATSDLSGKSFISTVDGLPVENLINAMDWLKEFLEKYPLVGCMHGLYFNSDGWPTPYYLGLKQSVKAHQTLKKSEDALYPACNMFSTNDDNEVDCIEGFKEERYPRLLSTPAQRDPRCACLTQNYLNSGKTRLYPHCAEFDQRCKFTTPELDKVLKEMSLS